MGLFSIFLVGSQKPRAAGQAALPIANFQRADAVDPALDSVAGRQRRDAGRRSRHDDVAGADRDLLRELPDDFRHAPDQLGEITLLPLGAVDRQPDLAFRRMPILEAGCSAEQGAE